MKRFILLCFSFGMCFRNARSAIEACANNQDCIDNEPNSHLCISANCFCDINYEIMGDDCSPMSCTDPTPDCGVDTACTNDAKCSCIANYQETVATCVQMICSAHAVCTVADANSYCVGTQCKCKINFHGTSVADCTRNTCSHDADCTNDFSYCVTTGTDRGCVCGTNSYPDSETGICTPITCTLANSATVCVGGASCIAKTNIYKCLCEANFSPGESRCVQKTCVTNNDCDFDSTCTNNLCNCAENYVASGTRCKKRCTSDVVCVSMAQCINGVCECNVNYEGNGAICTMLTCTTSATCHPNSQCSFGACTCATGFVVDGTMCRKSCNTNSACSNNAICLQNKCQCKQIYGGDGNTCTLKTCKIAADCGTNSACTNGLCSCADGYQIAATEVGCSNELFKIFNAPILVIASEYICVVSSIAIRWTKSNLRMRHLYKLQVKNMLNQETKETNVQIILTEDAYIKTTSLSSNGCITTTKFYVSNNNGVMVEVIAEKFKNQIQTISKVIYRGKQEYEMTFVDIV